MCATNVHYSGHGYINDLEVFFISLSTQKSAYFFLASGYQALAAMTPNLTHVRFWQRKKKQEIESTEQ